jgi:hypothetical protein
MAIDCGPYLWLKEFAASLALGSAAGALADQRPDVQAGGRMGLVTRGLPKFALLAP